MLAYGRLLLCMVGYRRIGPPLENVSVGYGGLQVV